MTTVRINPTDGRPTGEPRLASVASWAVLVASFGLSASTWIALAVLAGFTGTVDIFGVTLALAWLMPIAVDGYVVVALVLWMAPVPAKVAAFARKNTYFAAGTGIAAQSAYHLLFTMSTDAELWRVVLAAIVGALPPTVAGLAVHMRALIRRESGKDAATGTPPTSRASAATHTTSTVTVPAAPIVDRPAAPTLPASPVDTAAEPAPIPVSARPEIPTPADVATRITRPRTASPSTASPAAPRPAAAATRPRPTTSSTPVKPLTPPTTDISVSASDAVQLALPVVPPDLLARAQRVARQYHAEHGTAITAGQLAARLKVNSEEAAQALAVLDLDPRKSTAPVPTVNGHRTEATR